MTTTPCDASSNLPGKPPVADLATWQAARAELLVRVKAHTREAFFAQCFQANCPNFDPR
jgi:hypothetical protein